MPVVWRAPAIADLERQLAIVEVDRPATALKIAELVVNATQRLIDFPLSGRHGALADTREIVLTRYPYIIVYSVIGGTVFILNVYHHHQLWPSVDHPV